MSTNVPVSQRAGVAFTHPKDLPDDYYRMWDDLIEGLHRESLGMPMPTLASLLTERVATSYVRLRMLEDTGGAADNERMQRMWLSLAGEMQRLFTAAQQKPETRYMNGIKAAISTALRRVGQDATVREFLPVLVEELRPYDL